MQGERLQVVVPAPVAKVVKKKAKEMGMTVSSFLARLISKAVGK